MTTWRVGLLIALCMSGGHEARAIDRLSLDIGELVVPGAKLSGASVTLDLTGAAPTAQMQAVELELGPEMGEYRDLNLACARLLIREPRFACRNGRLNAKGGPLGSLALNVGASYDTNRTELVFEGSELAVAGGRAKLEGRIGERGWSVQSSAKALDIQKVRTLAAPWLHVPEDLSFDGAFDATLEASGGASTLNVRARATTPGFNFTNEASTVVAQNVAAAVEAVATRTAEGLEIETQLESTSGQALTGIVLFDFGANPLQVRSRARVDGKNVDVTALSVDQKDLATARGTGRVVLGERPRIARARIEFDSLQFPAAYTSYLQLALAATEFGTLQTTGSASGVVEIADNRVARVDGKLIGLDLKDANGKFSMQKMNGELHWLASETGAAQPSHLAWDSGSAYGLSGGPTRIDFVTRGLGFELTKPARLPVFDGAVVLETAKVNRRGGGDTELAVDGRIEPISMPLLSRAFGWPELSGQLSGSIPGLTYRDGELTVQGDLVASVFDGTIVGRNFRLRDPLGPFPRLYADVTARRLDLALVTNTFSIGSITGRLDADLNGLVLFDWSPIAFDARLYSTPGDRSKRLISQKAVTSISSVGGGGGAAAALQSGVMQFFDDFRYDRIGIACRLRNEVCLMSGIEPTGNGYYLVRGRGLPRIDIIGNAGRVAWRDLVARVVAQMRNTQKPTIR